MTDDFARFLSQMDQLKATMKDMSKIVGAYYSDLIEEGVPPDTAADLTIEFQRCMFGMGGGGDVD